MSKLDIYEKHEWNSRKKFLVWFFFTSQIGLKKKTNIVNKIEIKRKNFLYMSLQKYEWKFINTCIIRYGELTSIKVTWISLSNKNVCRHLVSRYICPFLFHLLYCYFCLIKVPLSMTRFLTLTWCKFLLRIILYF